MRRPSWLDQMLEQFQHRWETMPQFRAMWSGGFALGIVIAMCACLGVAAVAANNVSASMSGSNVGYNTGFDSPSGAKPQSTDVSFPLEAPKAIPAQNIPNANPIPASGTPEPTPTPQPTATPAPLPTGAPSGGGGGGGGCGNCSVTLTPNPNPIQTGASMDLAVHTSQPNVNFIINITWQNGAFYPATNGGSGYTTDGNGDGSVNGLPVPAGATANCSIKFWVTAQFPNGTYSNSFYEPCQ